MYLVPYLFQFFIRGLTEFTKRADRQNERECETQDEFSTAVELPTEDEVEMERQRLINEYNSKMAEINEDQAAYKKTQKRLEELLKLREEKIERADTLHFEGSRMLEEADDLAVEVEEVVDYEIAKLKDELQTTIDKMKRTGFKTSAKKHVVISCPVCLDEYTDERFRVALILCGHEFCDSCVKKLPKTTRTRTSGVEATYQECPMCSRKFYQEHVLKLYQHSA